MATRMSRRWFWEEIPDDSGACYAVMFLEDGESRGVTFALAYTQSDAHEILEAMRWYDAFDGGRGFSLPRTGRAAKPQPVKKSKVVAKSKVR